MVNKPKVLISLIGHQPLPILMTIRHEKPDMVIFLSSGDPLLQKRKHNLINLVCKETKTIDPGIYIDPWHFLSVPSNLEDILADHAPDNAQFVFDTTGGTKAMAIGLVQAAHQLASKQHDVRVVYLESEGMTPHLYSYRAEPQSLLQFTSRDDVNVLVTIEDFWRAHLGQVLTFGHRNPAASGSPFEEELEAEFALLRQQQMIDEVAATVLPPGTGELDFILRKGSRFALVECKSGKEAGKINGIYSLNNWASDRYLGTYTAKLLAVTLNYPPENKAVADAQNVVVLSLDGWTAQNRSLVPARQQINRAVKELFKL